MIYVLTVRTHCHCKYYKAQEDTLSHSVWLEYHIKYRKGHKLNYMFVYRNRMWIFIIIKNENAN